MRDTRWKSRIDVFNAIKNKIFQIIDVPEELTKLKTVDNLIISEASSLIQFMEKFDILVMLWIWQNILSKIYSVSKSMQS